MADENKAITFVLRQEDSKISGVVTDNPADRGGRTRFGIAETYNPDLTKTGFYDTMGFTEAFDLANYIYKSKYAAPLQIAKINSQDVANALLSFAINQGTGTAVMILQRSLGLDDDGILGPKTLAVINNNSPSFILNSLYTMESVYYNDIVKKNPSQHVFLAGWINRAKQNCMISV